jgi:hypothetical protein
MSRMRRCRVFGALGMGKIRGSHIGLFAVLLVTDCAASVPVARQFDLVCQGTLADVGMTSGHTSSRPTPFSSRIKVDLDTRRFCIDECPAVFHLTKVGGAQLEYHYDVEVADEDHAANRFRSGNCCSTAGPFPLKEDLIVDLSTGNFRRTYRYDEGDVAARALDLHFVGTCETAPFSGLPAPKR